MVLDGTSRLVLIDAHIPTVDSMNIHEYSELNNNALQYVCPIKYAFIDVQLTFSDH
jgi:hypothetical protein